MSCEANTSDVLSTNFLTSLLSLVLLFRFTKSLHNKYGYEETIVNSKKKRSNNRYYNMENLSFIRIVKDQAYHQVT